MLTVVPMVVGIADTALAKNSKRLQRLASPTSTISAASQTCHKAIHGGSDDVAAATSDYHTFAGEPLILCLLRQAQFQVSADTSGNMKRDMTTLRLLLSPP